VSEGDLHPVFAPFGAIEELKVHRKPTGGGGLGASKVGEESGSRRVSLAVALRAQPSRASVRMDSVAQPSRASVLGVSEGLS
jgi:hypothetical protein